MKCSFDSNTKIWEGPKIPYPYPLDTYIGELVLERLQKDPERVVQIGVDDGSLTIAKDLKLNIIRIAQNLTKLGVKNGDVVGFLCTNSLTLMPLFHACVQIGAVLNPLSVQHQKDDIKQMFVQTEPKLVFCDFEIYDRVREALNELKSEAKLFTFMGPIPGVPFVGDLMESTGIEESYQPIKFDDPSHKVIAILSSSGSTGPPKGVCVTQAYYLKFASFAILNQVNRILTFCPIFWGSALALLVMSPVLNEVRIVSEKPFSVELLLEIVEKHKPTNLLINIPRLTTLLQSPSLKTADISSVRSITTFGGIVTVQLRRKVQELISTAKLMVFYSLTETSVSATFPGVPMDSLTAGIILPFHKVKIVDDDENALDPGKSGEILVKFMFPFAGYYRNPEATKNAVTADGFFKTGDIGLVDENGLVYVIDRKKDIYKVSGHHINPTEIEEIVQTIDGVALACVVEVPNPETYNLSAAVIVKIENSNLTEKMVIDFIAERLPSHKQLKGGIYFVEKMPMTTTGKVFKRVIRGIAAEKFTEKKI